MKAITPVEQTLIDLLKIDSPTGGEHELANAVARWAEDAGWRVRRGLGKAAPERRGASAVATSLACDTASVPSF